MAGTESLNVAVEKKVLAEADTRVVNDSDAKAMEKLTLIASAKKSRNEAKIATPTSTPTKFRSRRPDEKAVRKTEPSTGGVPSEPASSPRGR